MITREDVPCWYELSWREGLGVVVRVHQDFARVFVPPGPDTPLVMHMTKSHGGENFQVTLGQDFGINGALKYLGQNGGFLEYLTPIVLCRKNAGKCRFCSGTGKCSWSSDESCICCQGTGEEYEYVYEEANRIGCSLGVLLDLLKFPEVTTSSSLSQLLTAAVSSQQGIYSIGGEYSAAMVRYLHFRLQGPIPEMIRAMESVSQKMEGSVQKHPFDRHSFRAELYSDARVNVTCPGDACGINPSCNYSSRGEVGYRFSDHNVDQPMQLMMLVASVSALHDLARAAKF